MHVQSAPKYGLKATITSMANGLKVNGREENGSVVIMTNMAHGFRGIALSFIQADLEQEHFPEHDSSFTDSQMR